MKNINAVIIDDEKDSRDIIKFYLENYFPSIKIIGEADSIKTGIKVLSVNSVDLLFLDIQLKDELSFDILKQLESCFFDIIFVTAHDEYAIQAIKHNALDYLLKPIDRSEFKQTVESFLNNKTKKDPNDVHLLLSSLDKSLRKKQIKLPTLTGFKLVDINSIVYLESDSNYTNIYMEDKSKTLVSKSLKEYERLLPDTQFCRIHNSYIINIDFLKEYKKGRGGLVILDQDIVLNVSQNRKNNLLDLWN